jgi:hypothetical protein
VAERDRETYGAYGGGGCEELVDVDLDPDVGGGRGIHAGDRSMVCGSSV